MSQQNVVFKVSSSSGFRRFSLSSGSFSFEELQQRLASIAACPSYAVSYVDDDGDEVAIGSDSELLEAVRVMQIASPDVNPLVIRLKLSLTDEPVSVVRPSERRLSLSSEGSQDDAIQVLREADPALPVDPQPLVQPAVAAPEPSVQQQQQSAAQEDPLVHVCITCDGCNQSPLVGVRYKCLQIDNYDLCQACFSRGVKANLAFISQEHPDAEPVFIPPRSVFPAPEQQPAPAPAPAPVSDADLGAHLVALVRSISSSCGLDIAPTLMAINPEDLSGTFEHRHPMAVFGHLRNLFASGSIAVPCPMFARQHQRQRCGFQQQQQQQQQPFEGPGRKCGGGNAPAPASSAPSSSDLPSPWIQGGVDSVSGCPYFVNTETGHSTWVKPEIPAALAQPAPSLSDSVPSPVVPSRQDQLIASGCPRPWAAAVVLAFGDNQSKVAETLGSFPFAAAAEGVESLVNMGFIELDARIALLHSSADVAVALDRLIQ